MKKVLVGSTLAVSLLLAGAGQSSAATIGVPNVNVNLGSMDIESALQMVQQQRLSQLDSQLDSQLQAQLAEVQKSSNTQQMDMLRLQSMTNKRNEAFDLMTNFVKKMQDSRSSIIGNMR